MSPKVAPMFDEVSRFASAADGLSLQAYAMRPRGIASGIVVIAHGAAEHALRYARFARALADAGYAVAALDHRGHGASCGPEGLGDFGAGGWDALVADIGQCVARARVRLCLHANQRNFGCFVFVVVVCCFVCFFLF